MICAPEAAPIIKAYSPELIVHPGLEPESVVQVQSFGLFLFALQLSSILQKLERMDAVVLGPGLGRNPLTQPLFDSVVDFVKRTDVPFVVDAVS